jgi:Lipocalin-like domain
LGGVLMLALSSSIATANDLIIGTWRVQSFVREVVPTGEQQNEFGEKPNGYIIYQPKWPHVLYACWR